MTDVNRYLCVGGPLDGDWYPYINSGSIRSPMNERFDIGMYTLKKLGIDNLLDDRIGVRRIYVWENMPDDYALGRARKHIFNRWMLGDIG